MADNEQNTDSSGKRALSNIVLLAASIYIGFLLYQSVYFNFQLNSKVEKLKTQIAKQETERLGFEAIISYYQTSTFQELEARRKLGMRFPGEKVVAVEVKPQQPDLDSNETLSGDSQRASSTNNLKLWLDFFTGKLKKV